ncbi:hypothetical protein Pcinc_032577 [Petrolisthes cinctipes]|uniref:Uncharacterized protein n=1 Tax=Petrolisthes cinctipes TaxID=88211 RepID=A0AAE1EUA9_PETCI|nr:hypothetical protein Pcinc_032577 [Petrolisthes cinctipes]
MPPENPLTQGPPKSPSLKNTPNPSSPPNSPKPNPSSLIRSLYSPQKPPNSPSPNNPTNTPSPSPTKPPSPKPNPPNPNKPPSLNPPSPLSLKNTPSNTPNPPKPSSIKRSLYRRMRDVCSVMSVEPLMLLDGLAFSNMHVYMENLQMDRVCRVSCGLTEGVCGDLRSHTESSVEVQRRRHASGHTGLAEAVSFLTAANAYLGDVTPEHTRTSRISLANSIWFLGGPLGTLMGTYIYNTSGYLALFSVSLTLSLLAFLYVLFCLSESHGPYARNVQAIALAEKTPVQLRDSVALVYGLSVPAKKKIEATSSNSSARKMLEASISNSSAKKKALEAMNSNTSTKNILEAKISNSSAKISNSSTKNILEATYSNSSAKKKALEAMNSNSSSNNNNNNNNKLTPYNHNSPQSPPNPPLPQNEHDVE